MGDEKPLEWKKVRRRKTPAKKNTGEVTTYFVTNIPEGARKNDLQKIYTKYTNMSDIYL